MDRKILNNSGSSQLFCFGGRNDDYEIISSVSRYDSSSEKWKSCREMSTKRCRFGATVIDDKIYIAGGQTGYDEMSKNMEMFDYESEIWKNLAPMTLEREDFGMATLNGFIYIAGGNDCSGNILSSVERYCPASNSWMEVVSMNKNRMGLQLVTLNGQLYAVGGEDDKSAERYDAENNQWTMLSSTKHFQYYFGITAHHDRIYVLCENGFEVYDPKSDQWQTLPTYGVGFGPNLISFNDKLLAVGGGQKSLISVATKYIWEFDINGHKWRQLDDMDAARMHHCSLVVNCSK